jgi:hypothetical protein
MLRLSLARGRFRRYSSAPKAGSQAKDDYQHTLLLPKTDLPMRAQSAKREHLIQANCFSKLYDWQYNRTDATGKFILHDGPPFANGPPHVGHALNKVLKDMICRHQIMLGKSVSHVPGWDCHGLPIEHKALLEVAKSKGATGTVSKMSNPASVRKLAKNFALEAIDVQRKAFQRWGILADWKHPYLTMDPLYEVEQLKVFKDMYEKVQLSPHHHCSTHGRALFTAVKSPFTGLHLRRLLWRKRSSSIKRSRPLQLTSHSPWCRHLTSPTVSARLLSTRLSGPPLHGPFRPTARLRAIPPSSMSWCRPPRTARQIPRTTSWLTPCCHPWLRFSSMIRPLFWGFCRPRRSRHARTRILCGQPGRTLHGSGLIAGTCPHCPLSPLITFPTRRVGLFNPHRPPL